MSSAATANRSECTDVFDLPNASPPEPSLFDMDCSPFGLQGLMRDTLTILKPDYIERLAVTLALRGTHQQIQDLDYVRRQLSYHPEWQDEYQVVHLIEKSLWIQGHSNLVLTMTKNPSKVPDNPPPVILEALSRAYVLHPEATIWYGVPLFSDETNEEGLPIPVTQEEVRAEAERRLLAAQSHALKWGWFYRSALQALLLPSRGWHACQQAYGRVQGTFLGMVEYCKKAHRDRRDRARATIIAELERCRFGCSQTVIPEHGTWLGRGVDLATTVLEVIEYQASIIAYITPFAGSAVVPLTIASFIPKLIIPLTMVTVDPFLFVELPDEPGKLRHLGHWYWQAQKQGQKKLHLHAS